MTGANKQAQWFGPTLSSVLAQSETAGERVVRNSAAWPRSTYVYWRYVYIMGAPLVHDICVGCVCVMCALVLSTTVRMMCFFFRVFQVEAGTSKARHCQLGWNLTQGYGR